MAGIEKSETLEKAISGIHDGARVMVGGFGVPGTPFYLIEALLQLGCMGLTLIKNDANETGMGVDHLLKAGQVRKLITSHIGLNPRAIEMMNKGTLEVELCSQGILAERIRAAGAGLPGFFTDIGIGTPFAEGKQRIEIQGETYLIESAIQADFALVHAAKADAFGNLLYRASAQNFNPLMAQAADRVIVEAEEIGAPGSISADAVHTPGPFIDCVVEIPEITEVYGVVQR